MSLFVPMQVEAKQKRTRYTYKTLKRVTVYKGKSKKITLKKKSGMKYSTTNKKIATVKKHRIYGKKKGKCTIKVQYKNKIYKIPVTVKVKSSKPVNNKPDDKPKDDVNSWKTVKTDTVTAEYSEVKNDTYQYSLVHIKLKNPSKQIKHGTANDLPVAMREYTSDFGERKKAVLAVNASYFMCASGQNYYTDSIGCSSLLPYNRGVCLINGKLYQSDGFVLRDTVDYSEKTTGSELCLTKDGSLFTPEKGVSAQELVSMGVTDTIACSSEPVLIKDGVVQEINDTSSRQRYNRMAVGMVKPGEYYILAAGGIYTSDNTNHGMTQKEVQDLFAKYGCTFARCMDGGGSATMYFNGQVRNDLKYIIERPVPDFLYFVN